MTWPVVVVLGHDLTSRGPRDNVLHGGGPEVVYKDSHREVVTWPACYVLPYRLPCTISLKG